MNQSENSEYLFQRKERKRISHRHSWQRNWEFPIKRFQSGKRENVCPDYNGIIDSLCKELEIPIAELMDGDEAEPDSIRNYDDGQILELVKRIQNLENQRIASYRILFMAAGTALFGVHFCVGGSEVRDFIPCRDIAWIIHRSDACWNIPGGRRSF